MTQNKKNRIKLAHLQNKPISTESQQKLLRFLPITLLQLTRLRLLLRLDGPELADSVGEPHVVADDVEQAPEGRDGDQVDQGDRDLRQERAQHAGSRVVNCYRFQTPEIEK